MGHDPYAEHLTPSNPQVVAANIRTTVGVHRPICPRSSARFLLLVLLSLIPAALAQNTIHIPADQPTIQAGINAAHNGDTVLVSPGTYYENIDFLGKAITVTSSGGPASTIIDGGAKAPVVTFNNGEARASILSNLTIRNGGATPGTVGTGTWGGIFTGLDSNPSILNNLIMQNACNGYFGSGGALLQGNTISGTLPPSTPGCSYGEGAAVFLKGSSTTLPVVQVIGNIIENNVHPMAANWGAVSINGYIGAIVENNIIRNNAMTGIYAVNSNSMVIEQNLVYSNTSTNQAGGMYALIPFSGIVGPPIGIIANNTFVQNSGSQVSLGGNLSQFDFVNNIVVGSGSAAPFLCGYPPADSLSLTPIVIDHNDIYNASDPAYGPGCPDQTGTYGNLSANPLFTNPATADFHLSPSSPAIDTGNNSVSPLLAKDLDGNPRPQDATGNGYPIVDMGAYEYPGQQDANATSFTLTPSSYQPAGGSTITLTATLLSASGVPTGSVTFLEDNQQIGASIIDANGTATFSTSGLVPGIHAFTATYSGQSSFKPAFAVKFFVLVGQYTVPNTYPTTISLSSSVNPAVEGQPITFSVNISASTGVPNGPVTVTDGPSGPIIANLTLDPSGQASFINAGLSIGVHNLSATYVGNSSYATSNTTLTQTIIIGYPSPTSFTSSPNPAPYGQPVTFTTTTTFQGYPNTTPATGTMTYSDVTGLASWTNAPVLAVRPITAQNGTSATTAFTTSSLSVGRHLISVAVYAANGFASAGQLTQVITGSDTSTTLTSSLNPANPGQSVAFTAIVTNTSSTGGTPTGSITFTDGTTLLATQPLATSGSTTGTASFSTSSLSPGPHTITATYVAIGGFAASTATLTQNINTLPDAITFIATPAISYPGQSVTLSAVVAGASTIPTGSVTFYDIASPIGTVILDATGQATYSTTTLSLGSHTLSAHYAGNTVYSPNSSAPVTVLVQAPDFTLTLASPTFTVQTGHIVTTAATLASLGSFADTVALTCTNLPADLACTFTPNPATLTASGPTTVSLTLDTANTTSGSISNRASPLTLALLLSPASLFLGIGALRRRRTPLSLLLLLLAILPMTLTLGGCGVVTIPTVPVLSSVAPGTYTIPITATGATTGLTHTVQLTLTVTP